MGCQRFKVHLTFWCNSIIFVPSNLSKSLFSFLLTYIHPYVYGFNLLNTFISCQLNCRRGLAAFFLLCFLCSLIKLSICPLKSTVLISTLQQLPNGSVSTHTFVLCRGFPLSDQIINPPSWCLECWPIRSRIESKYLCKDGKRTGFGPQALFQLILPTTVSTPYRKSFCTADFGESHSCKLLFSNITGSLFFTVVWMLFSPLCLFFFFSSLVG